MRAVALSARLDERERTFTLADSFDATGEYRVDLTAPLPLGYANAVRRALQLRNSAPTRWTYNNIAEVMSAYHGWHMSGSWWQVQLREAGAAPQPRGNAWDAVNNPAKNGAA